MILATLSDSEFLKVLEICDTAVKVGLGALLSGVFTYFGVKANARITLDKIRFEQRSKMLTEVAQSVESLFNSYMMFSNHLKGIEGVKIRPLITHYRKMFATSLPATRW
jgi:hypothetical protein